MSYLKTALKNIINFIGTVIIAVLIAFFIKEFFLEFQLIPTGSMIPYLQVGDRLVVSRMSFGIQNPLYNVKKKKSIMLLMQNPLYKANIPFSDNLYFYKRNFKLNRYDTVVFFPPEEPIWGREYYFAGDKRRASYFEPPGLIGEKYVKRILGLPGEVLELRQGYIYINNKKLDEPFPVNRDYFDFGPVLIPPKSYFMIGDNRPRSSDSRYWGPVPEENLLGRALVVFWPFNRMKKIESYGTKFN
jgi:signal peptidase I